MTLSPHNEEALRARAEQRLSAFVLRARRVEAHSLVRSAEFMGYLQGSLTVLREEGQETVTVVARCPPEEQLESAIARVRPLILQDEPIFYGNVLKDISFTLRHVDDPELARQLQIAKAEWKKVNPRGTSILGYGMQILGADGSGRSRKISDNELAFAWIYGDVLHADQERLATLGVSRITDRYRAAVPIVCRILFCTVATLNLVRSLNHKAHLRLPEEITNRPVVESRTQFVHQAKMYVAPAAEGAEGSAMPDLSNDLGPEWELFDPAMHASPNSESTPSSLGESMPPTGDADPSQQNDVEPGHY